jgi:hypothetical protein
MPGFGKELSMFMLAHFFSSLFNNATQKNHLLLKSVKRSFDLLNFDYSINYDQVSILLFHGAGV